MITPHLASQWDTNRRSLDQLEITLIYRQTRRWGNNKTSFRWSLHLYVPKIIKDHLCFWCVSLCETTLVIKPHVFQSERTYFLQIALCSCGDIGYCFALALKVSFNNTSLLLGVTFSLCVKLFSTVFILFAIKNNEQGPCAAFSLLFVFVYM